MGRETGRRKGYMKDGLYEERHAKRKRQGYTKRETNGYMKRGRKQRGPTEITIGDHEK